MTRRPPEKSSAGLLLISGSRMLVLRRSPRSHNPDLWDLPGGQRDDGEDVRDAAWREAAEEIGSVPPAVVAGCIRVLRRRGRKRYDIFVCRTTRDVAGSWPIEVDHEHSGYRWVELSWCLARPARLHPVLRALLDDPRARRALRRQLRGKRGFRSANSGSKTSSLSLRVLSAA